MLGKGWCLLVNIRKINFLTNGQYNKKHNAQINASQNYNSHMS